MLHLPAHEQFGTCACRARPMAWRGSLGTGSAYNTLAGAVCVECAAVGCRTQRVLCQDDSRPSLSAVHMQAALVLFDVQTARATKQWDLRTLISRPGHRGGEL
jgi:hypothetical protein